MKYLFSLAFTLFAMASTLAQPSNDDCSGIISLGTAPNCTLLDTFSNVGATESLVFSNPSDNLPTCFTTGTIRDVWFQFMVPADGSVIDFTIELTGVNGPNGSIVQPQMAVYRGDCLVDGLAELKCATSAVGETSVSLDLTGTTPGLPLLLRISDWSASAMPNWGDFTLCVKGLEPKINMGEASASAVCAGTLYDSGGPNGDYSSNENHIFTVCPQLTTACISVNIVQISTEEGFDFLRVFAGNSTSAPLFASFDGFGSNVLLDIPSQCVTFQFISDDGSTDSGFELNWLCSPIPCTIAPPSTCSNPTQIPSLPFNANDLTTCNAQDAVSSSPCDDNDWLQGEDVVFTYISEGDECIEVKISGSSDGTAVGIFDDCPELASNCIDVEGGETEGPDPMISAAFLSVADTYYIVVDNPLFCTPFHIEVNTVTCPVIMPSAALCENAQSLHGCQNQTTLPTIVYIAPGQGDPEFLNDTVNIGCWGGFEDPNFTFFYFQAQSNGEFAFVMESANPDEASDIDFQVWGPISNFEDICDFAEMNQPIRSSYAQGAGPTGLSHIHPASGASVIDTCELAGFPPDGGDGFLKPVQVQDGEYYLVMINDYGGDIESGAISINFSGTTQGILDPFGANFTVTQDTAICPGASVQLLATGGDFVQWFPKDGLSCQYCQNPIASITQSTTYHVSINTLCLSDTFQVDINTLNVNIGPDLTICLNEDIQIKPESNFSNANYQWTGSVGFLSCTDCAMPTITGIQAGSFAFEVTATGPNCSITDSMVLTVLPNIAPAYQISPDQHICTGTTISLGGPATSGVNYLWSANPFGFSSTLSNPTDAPTQSTTYYLQTNNDQCPFPSLDSVVVIASDKPNFVLFSNDTICPGEQVVLCNSVPEPGVVYQWTPSLGLMHPDSLNAVASPAQQTTYTLLAINGACFQMDSVVVDVSSTPILEISPDAELPCGTSEYQLFAQTTTMGGYYLWSSGDTIPNPVVNLVLGTNIFSLTYTNACKDTLEAVVVLDVSVGPTVEIAAEADSVYLGVEIVLEADTTNATSILWSNGSLSDTAVVVPMSLPAASFSVTVSDEFGCTATDTITLEVLEPIFAIPNSFSPNGDNLNEVFNVVVKGENLEVESIQIWNRWGEKVFDSKNSNQGWDGRQHEKDCPSDVYIYSISIQLPDGTFYNERGDLTLLR